MIDYSPKLTNAKISSKLLIDKQSNLEKSVLFKVIRNYKNSTYSRKNAEICISISSLCGHNIDKNPIRQI